ncbi:hypothetical protein CGRA01v4_05868 [Colletotrichum graminicola]|nr:hypothetical protein CGRA01v4_05868 [Colletotrichum graminicola]
MQARVIDIHGCATVPLLLLVVHGGPTQLAPLIGTPPSFWDDGNICSITTRKWRRGIVSWRRSWPYTKPYSILIVPANYQAPRGR